MSLVNFNKPAAQVPQNDIAINGNSTSTITDACKPNGVKELLAAATQNMCIHFVSDGNWSMYDFLIAAVLELGKSCNVWITTYSMTELSARVLAQMKDKGEISDLHLLMDYKSKMRYPEVDQLIRNVASSIGLTHLHAKVLVINNGNKFITMLGSANWTKNPRIETGVIDTSTYIALGHINWITQKISQSINDLN